MNSDSPWRPAQTSRPAWQVLVDKQAHLLLRMRDIFEAWAHSYQRHVQTAVMQPIWVHTCSLTAFHVGLVKIMPPPSPAWAPLDSRSHLDKAALCQQTVLVRTPTARRGTWSCARRVLCRAGGRAGIARV